MSYERSEKIVSHLRTGFHPNISPHFHEIVLFFIVLISRLPFLNAGFGLDNDSWQVANVASEMRDTLHYISSRAPGFPVHEILCAFLIPGGFWATNALSALSAAAAVLVFYRSLRTLNIARAFLLSLALASMPPLFLASTATIDYCLAFLFQVLSFYFLLMRRNSLSGALLGLAAGTRLPSLLVLPAWLFLAHKNGCSKTRLITSTALSSALFYSPFLLTYGVKELHAYPPPQWLGFDFAFLNGVFWPFGLIGSLALISAMVALLLPQFHQEKQDRPGRKDLIQTALITIIPLIVVFILLPLEPGYLIPIFPFLLLIFAVVLESFSIITLCACLVLSPWIDITSQGISAGPILRDNQLRLTQQKYVAKWIEQAAQFSEPTIIVAVAYFPMIYKLASGSQVGKTTFYWSISYEAAQQARAQGVKLYVLEGIEDKGMAALGYDFVAAGFTVLAREVD